MVPRTKKTVATNKAPVAGKPAISAWLPAVIVWTIWSLMLFAALFFVATWGHDLPFGDDFALARAFTGVQPVTLEWLWSQHNEHRLFLPRLALLASYKVTGSPFLAIMYFDVLALGAAAFLLICVARRLRGSIAYADAIFPVALLHWGHWENLIWSIQVSYVLPSVLVFILLAVIVLKGNALSLGSGILAGTCLLSLPLCMASGLPFVPPLACWLGYWGVRLWRSGRPHGRRDGAVLLALAVAAVALCAFYFVGLKMHPNQALNPGLWASLLATVRFLCMSLGIVGRQLWPVSAWLWLPLAALSVAGVMFAYRKLPRERLRLVGLVLFLAGVLALAGGIGWGRARFGSAAGTATRYALLALPILFWSYFVFLVYGGRMNRALTGTMAALVCGLLYLHMTAGLEQAERTRYNTLKQFERDLREGTPWLTLAKSYSQKGAGGILTDTPRLAYFMALLCRGRIDPFQHLRGSHMFQGNHEPHAGDCIRGWVWDADRPYTPLGVDIYDGEDLLATVLANDFRPGLLKIGIGDGQHGFQMPIPASLKDGKPHAIHVTVAGTEFELTGTPRTLTVAADGSGALSVGRRGSSATGKE